MTAARAMIIVGEVRQSTTAGILRKILIPLILRSFRALFERGTNPTTTTIATTTTTTTTTTTYITTTTIIINSRTTTTNAGDSFQIHNSNLRLPICG